ncbi:aspartate aminotransferase family protein [Embleya sp. NPDC008237]|uniref:aminotransferase family protein n=1 Tax=Embleya sp. NPDC008237 TaxID=3363978 RepID=UPI0036E4339E
MTTGTDTDTVRGTASRAWAATVAARAADAAHLWHPWSPIADGRERLLLVAGRGSRVVDDTGRSYLDLRAGTLNATIGYGHPGVAETIAAQARTLMTWDLAEAGTIPAALLAGRIAAVMPPGLDRTLLCNSGSEAIEAAIKIARMWHRLCGRPRRTAIVSWADGYHGATTAGIAATGSEFRRHGCGPLPEGYAHLASPRCPDCATGAGDHTCRIPGPVEWEEHIARIGPDTVAAVLVEPILGVGGVIVPPPGSLRGLREICDRHDIVLIADEVATGFGRTGRTFAFEHDLAPGTGPDIVTTAKGLTGGYAPLSAVTVRGEIHAAFARDPLLGGLRHGHTTGGHASACAAALAVLDVLAADRLVEAAAARGAQFRRDLAGLDESPLVREVRGKGLLIGIETTSLDAAARVAAAAQERGVLIRHFGPVITIAPPLNITPHEVGEGAGAVVDAVRATSAGSTA